MERAIKAGVGLALIALILAGFAFVLEERAAMMVSHAKADALLDQSSITVQSANRYAAEERLSALKWMGNMNALVIRTNQNVNGCPHCPPSVMDDVHAMVRHTDLALNGKGGVLYQADKLLADSNASLNDDKTGLLPSTALAVLVAASSVKDVSQAAIPVIQHADDLVNSPAIKGSLSSTDAAMKHVNNVADAVDKLAHPPKRSRGQRALQWILQTVFGNAVQGAVRR